MAAALERLHQRNKLPKRWRREKAPVQFKLTWRQTVRRYYPEWSHPYMFGLRTRWERYLSIHPHTRVLWFCWRYRSLSQTAKHVRDYDKIRKGMAVIHPRIVRELPDDWILLTDCVVDAFLDGWSPHEGLKTPRFPTLVNSWDRLVLSIEHSLGENDSISRTSMKTARVCVSNGLPSVECAWWAQRMHRHTQSHERLPKYMVAPHWVADEDKDEWEALHNL